MDFYYEEEDDSAPVEKFLDKLPKKQKAKALALIKLLEEQGINLPFPYSSQVRGRLRELRTQFGKTRLRILYFANSRRIFMLLHGIVKTTDKLSEGDILAAEQRMEAHTRRLERRK